MVQRLRGEAGANAVEFALVLPILLAIVLAILWGGMALNSQMTLSQTAREGARYGATLPYPDDPSDPAAMGAWFDEVETRLLISADIQRTSGGLTGCILAFQDTNAIGSRSINGGTCGGTQATAPVDGMSRVEVSLVSPANFDFFWGGGIIDLSADAIARHEGRTP